MSLWKRTREFVETPPAPNDLFPSIMCFTGLQSSLSRNGNHGCGVKWATNLRLGGLVYLSAHTISFLAYPWLPCLGSHNRKVGCPKKGYGVSLQAVPRGILCTPYASRASCSAKSHLRLTPLNRRRGPKQALTSATLNWPLR